MERNKKMKFTSRSSERKPGTEWRQIGQKNTEKISRSRAKWAQSSASRSLARTPSSLFLSLSLSRYGAPSFLPGFCTEPGHPGNTRVHDRVASHLFVTHLYFFFILAYTEILTFYNAKHKRKLFLNPLAHSDIYLYLCVCARFRQNATK